ncbi:MAG TPA: AI-2E family transporter [Longimicrobiales bacterium]
MAADRPRRDRRRDDRRSDDVRLADFTIPEMRKALLTAGLLLAIFLLFAYMVADVAVAVVAGVVLGVYAIPFHRWLGRRLHTDRVAAIVTITLVTVPLLAILIYSWVEIAGAAAYMEANRAAVAERLTIALRRVPFAHRIAVEQDLSRWVIALGERTAFVLDEVRDAFDILVISVAVFLFTVYYILTDHRRILRYIRRKIPGRYRDLSRQVSANIRAVVYGALYATFLVQLLKAAVVLSMNLLWDIPLAVVLSIVAFFIGFFPIVGSWVIYLSVALYLAVFRNDIMGAAAMALIGFTVNTVFLSMYVRPKIAAEKSHVLNFYWMFIALVTGVYTFGLVGIIVGPVLIGVLKAIFDTVTGDGTPVRLEAPSEAAYRRRAAG